MGLHSNRTGVTKRRRTKVCEHPVTDRAIETETNEVMCLNCGELRPWLPADAWEARQERLRKKASPVVTGEVSA